MLQAQKAIRTMRVLVVEADDAHRLLICEKFRFEGFNRVREALSGDDALRQLSAALAQREPIDLVCLGLNLPDRPGTEAFEEIRSVFDVAVLLLAWEAERPLATEAVGRGAEDYIVRPVHPGLLLLKAEKLLIKRFLHRELHRSTARNETLFLNVLAVMAKVIEAKDPYTRSHSENVSTLASEAAREMGFQDDEVKRIGVGGILHDLGKMGIKEAILKKPGPLDESERQMVQRHPVLAATILEPIEQLQGALSYIRHHHEHYNGTGYPDGLSGEEIPLGARIIHACEAYDSMTSARAYSGARPPLEALTELRKLAGEQFDPQVVEALTEVLRRREMTSSAEQDRTGRSLSEIIEDITGKVRVEDGPEPPASSIT